MGRRLLPPPLAEVCGGGFPPRCLLAREADLDCVHECGPTTLSQLSEILGDLDVEDVFILALPWPLDVGELQELNDLVVAGFFLPGEVVDHDVGSYVVVGFSIVFLPESVILRRIHPREENRLPGDLLGFELTAVELLGVAVAGGRSCAEHFITFLCLTMILLYNSQINARLKPDKRLIKISREAKIKRRLRRD